MRALVLGGGGSKGAYQAGVLDALWRRGIRWDVVYGVSIGAINGAILAQGDADRLRTIWVDEEFPRKALRRRKWPHQFLTKGSVYDDAKLREAIEEVVHPGRLHLSPIRLVFGAACIEDGTMHWFDGQSEGVIDRLMATCALPLIFPPLKLDGRTFVDGGVISNVPVLKAVEDGADTVFVVPNSPKQLEPIKAEGLGIYGTLKRVIQISLNSSTEKEIRIADLVTEVKGPLRSLNFSELAPRKD